MNIDKRREKLIARLKDKEHRDAFVSADIDVGISFQIRAIREQRGWIQKELADHAGVKQPWIARLESPYGGFSLQTLKKLASAFDVGLLVRFVPISELVERELKLSPESLTPVSFEEDLYFKPQPITVPCQSGWLIGGSASLECPRIQKESPEIKKMGKLLHYNIGQKATDQKEMDSPLHDSLGEVINQ